MVTENATKLDNACAIPLTMEARHAILALPIITISLIVHVVQIQAHVMDMVTAMAWVNACVTVFTTEVQLAIRVASIITIIQIAFIA